MQKRQNFIYIFLAFFVLSVAVFFLFKLPILKPVTSITQNIFSPIQKITHNTFSSIGSFFSNSTINQLRKENLDLSKKLVDQSKIEADNKALRDQFETTYPKSQTLLMAKIIGAPGFIPGFTTVENFILDKGEKDGVKKGQSVIYKDNLVGVVVQASYNESLVSLITNSSFLVTSKMLGNKSFGVVKGLGQGEMILDNVLLSDNLNKNDLVVTKGSADLTKSGILPDLVLGKIVTINKNPSSLFQTAKVQSLIDFSKLQNVFIINSQ